MKFELDWGVFFHEIPGGGDRYVDLLFSGVAWTLAVSASAWVIALVLGSVIGTMRTTDRPWMVRLGDAWVELFRNVPLLVQMFLWYFVVPEFIAPLKRWVVQADPPGLPAPPGGPALRGMGLGPPPPEVLSFLVFAVGVRLVLPPLDSETMN